MIRASQHRHVLAVILAGGRGERLHPLTQQRSKPSVPFGGAYRIIDFTLSNCVNSGYRRVYVLTQYKSQSLNEHLATNWSVFNAGLDEFVYPVPPQQLKENLWYEGTADAIYQNLIHIRSQNPRHLLVLSGDHIYKMDYAELVAEHLKNDADLTMSVMPYSRAESTGFGIVAMEADGRVTDFIEKPTDPPPMPGHDDLSLVNMGVYVFKAKSLYDALEGHATAEGLTTRHDFGKHVIPALVKEGAKVYAVPFLDDEGKTPYWRDIGTLDSYFDANLDLVSVQPQFNLYEKKWPIRARGMQLPPVKTVFSGVDRAGRLLDSIACGGVVVSGGTVSRSVLGPLVRVNSFAEVTESILFENVQIGRRAIVRRAIIDKNVHVPADCQIGVNPDLDRARGFVVTPSGLTVIPKGATIT